MGVSQLTEDGASFCSASVSALDICFEACLLPPASCSESGTGLSLLSLFSEEVACSSVSEVLLDSSIPTVDTGSDSFFPLVLSLVSVLVSPLVSSLGSLLSSFVSPFVPSSVSSLV